MLTPFVSLSLLSALSTAEYIHIRIQQRNGRKTITTLQGVPTEYDPKKLLKAFKSEFAFSLSSHFFPRPTPLLRAQGKESRADFCRTRAEEFACNGSLVEDEEMGQVIQLQGDQRTKILGMLVEEGISEFLLSFPLEA